MLCSCQKSISQKNYSGKVCNILQSQKKKVLKHYPENHIVRHSPHILYFMCIFFSLCWGIPTHYSVILFWKSRLTNITDDNPRCSRGISYRSLALSLHPLESLTGLAVKWCVRCFPLTQLQSQASHSVPSLHENSLHYTKAGFAKRINQRQFQKSSDLMVHFSEFLLTQQPWKAASTMMPFL